MAHYTRAPSPPSWAGQSNLSSNVKFDPVDKRFIMDGAGMSGPTSKGFKVCFPSPANVCLIDGRERDQVDQVNLDLTVAHTVPTTRFHFRPSP
jgi:hypothetical protein